VSVCVVGTGGGPAARYSVEVLSRRGTSDAVLEQMAAVALTPERLAMGGEEAEYLARLPSREEVAAAAEAAALAALEAFAARDEVAKC